MPESRSQIQTPYAKPERYIKCPACGKSEHQVSHLPAGVKTAWYCDDCGVRFRLHVISPDAVECEAMEERKLRRLVTLRSTGPVTLLVEGMSFSGESDESGNAEYFYNEQTCPTNFLDRVVKVMDADGDDDPHGVFQFVSIEPWPS